MSFPFNFLGRLFRPDHKRQQIEAGGGGRRWEGGIMLHSPAQSALAARGASKARSNALYINSPQANRAVEAWVPALGHGWHARPAHPDPARRKALAEGYEELMRPILLPMVRALVRDGESFVQLSVARDGELRPKLIPSDQIDPNLTRDLGNGVRIVAGIEYDADDRVTAYHVLREAPGSPFALFGEAVRVPAVDMLHIFDQLFPGQVRGITWLAPVLLRLRDRDEAADALLMQLKVASMMTGFIRDPDGTMADMMGTASGGALNVSLEPGAMRILPQNADVTFSNPVAGLAQAVEFLRAQDREIASGVGLTFEMLTGDLGEANYSSARVGLLDFRRRAEMLQRNLIEAGFLRPLWRRWIEVQSLAGSIPANALADHLAVRFVPPGWAWVDPKNEVEADVAAINAGLKSREEVVAGRGRDIEELDEERARDLAQPANGGTEE